MLLSSPTLFLLGVICGPVGVRTSIGKVSLALNLVGLVGIVLLILFFAMLMSSMRC